MPSTNDQAKVYYELNDKLKHVKHVHEDWREESRKLEARLADVNREVAELQTQAANLESDLQANAEDEQLNNSLQILTCLKDVMMPYHSILLPKDPRAMTRKQKVVHHFLNEVQAATARQTPQVDLREPREPRVWRP